MRTLILFSLVLTSAHIADAQQASASTFLSSSSAATWSGQGTASSRSPSSSPTAARSWQASSYSIGSDEYRDMAAHNAMASAASAVMTPSLMSAPGSRFDPPDSLYKLARTALTDGDFKKAATAFASLAERYPDSPFASDALYWRAYALYKSGSSRELSDAVTALDRQAARYPKAGTLSDAKQLRASIRSEQAKRGDSNAGLEITQGGTNLGNQNRCPTDDDEMRFTALAGIAQNDPDQVIPVVLKLLARRDECSIALRKRAVYTVAQTKEEERAEILLNVVRTDPAIEVRREAVQWLSSVNTDRAAKALDSILFSPGNAELRERALSALSQHRSPSARESLRRFAEQASVPTDLRVRAINNMSNRRGGDEGEYFRTLFGKTASPEIREAIIQAISSQKTADRTPWLLGVARDKNHEVEVRKKALYYAGQTGVDIKDVTPLYDEFAGQKEMQEQMLYVYGQRREVEATDKLLQIARTEKDPDLRRKAVQWLGSRKNDARVTKFLLELLDQPVR